MRRPTRATVVWWVLIIATVVNLELTSLEGSAQGARVARLAVLLVAFFKVRLVIMNFMEVAHERPVVRLVMEMWVTLTCGALVFQLW